MKKTIKKLLRVELEVCGLVDQRKAEVHWSGRKRIDWATQPKWCVNPNKRIVHEV